MQLEQEEQQSKGPFNIGTDIHIDLHQSQQKSHRWFILRLATPQAKPQTARKPRHTLALSFSEAILRRALGRWQSINDHHWSYQIWE